jgi:hypothetical protein
MAALADTSTKLPEPDNPTTASLPRLLQANKLAARKARCCCPTLCGPLRSSASHRGYSNKVWLVEWVGKKIRRKKMRCLTRTETFGTQMHQYVQAIFRVWRALRACVCKSERGTLVWWLQVDSFRTWWFLFHWFRKTSIQMFGAERHQGKDYSEFKGHHRVVQMLHGALGRHGAVFSLVATWCSCEVALHDRRHPGGSASLMLIGLRGIRLFRVCTALEDLVI